MRLGWFLQERPTVSPGQKANNKGQIMEYPKLLLGFDIETSEQAQDDKISPITVASTVTSDGEKRAWFSHPTDESIVGMLGKQDEDWSNFSPDGKLAPLMSQKTALAMLKYMEEKQNQGYSLCAWNGAGFDLKMIGFLAGNLELAGRMALDLIDPMYQVLSMKGYPVGLSAVQKGLGTEQEKSMQGSDAPEAWLNGEYQKVISYVIGDSEMTVEIIQAIAKVGGIKWAAKSGKPNSLMLPKLKTVAECLKDPEPDNSWMDKPIKRRDMIKWIPESSYSIKPKGTIHDSTKSVSPIVLVPQVNMSTLEKSIPVVLVISGPSGVGKSIICNDLCKNNAFERAITFTTRKPRNGEKEGVDYYFVNDEKFDKIVKAGDFIEHSEVHGYKYGSAKVSISMKLAKGKNVVIILDVNGTKKAREFFQSLPENTKSKFRYADIFIMPPSMEELRNRLVGRGADSEENIEQRLLTAKTEIGQAPSYRYTITNDNLGNSISKISAIVVAEKSRS